MDCPAFSDIPARFSPCLKELSEALPRIPWVPFFPLFSTPSHLPPSRFLLLCSGPVSASSDPLSAPLLLASACPDPVSGPSLPVPPLPAQSRVSPYLFRFSCPDPGPSCPYPRSILSYLTLLSSCFILLLPCPSFFQSSLDLSSPLQTSPLLSGSPFYALSVPGSILPFPLTLSLLRLSAKGSSPP